MNDFQRDTPEVGSAPPSGGDPVSYNPIQEINAYESLLGSNPAEAVLEVMRKMNASPAEIADVELSMKKMGIKLSDIHIPVLQAVVLQLVLDRIQMNMVKTVAEQGQTQLDQFKEGGAFAIANFRNQIRNDLEPILDKSIETHLGISTELERIENYLTQLTAGGSVAEQFSEKLLERMGEGVISQVLTIKGKLDEELDRQKSHITQVSTDLNAVVKNIDNRLNKTLNSFDAMSTRAEQKFEATLAHHETKYVELVGKFNQTVQTYLWLERYKIWGGSMLFGSLGYFLTFYLSTLMK